MVLAVFLIACWDGCLTLNASMNVVSFLMTSGIIVPSVPAATFIGVVKTLSAGSISTVHRLRHIVGTVAVVVVRTALVVVAVMVPAQNVSNLL